MVGIIRIDIHPTGLTQVFISQPGEEAASDRLWFLYRALRPHISNLEHEAKQHALLVCSESEYTA